MAKKKTELTDIKLEDAYNQIKALKEKFTKTEFAVIIDTNKQNLGGRISNNGSLSFDEVKLLLKYLASEDLSDNSFYKELSQTVNPVKSRNEIKEVKSSDNEDFAELNVRGDVGLSCGYGTVVYNDNVTGKCRVPRQTLRDYGASVSSTEVVYAQGDSMSPEIKSGDALLVDTSQTDIIDGVVYAFNYDGQPMCKRLQKIGKEIKAISSNPLFDPFIIDFTCQFNIVGRVVGFMRPVL